MATPQQMIEGMVSSGQMTADKARTLLARFAGHGAAAAGMPAAAGGGKKQRNKHQRALVEEEDEGEHDVDLGAVGAAAAGEDCDAGNDGSGTYQLYQPKLVKEGKAHPDPVVETLTLAAMVPPKPTYVHHLGAAVASGALSSLQLESIIYACQRFEGPRLTDSKQSRAGFFLGDGAGVGKGRQLAGLAYEHWRTGGKRIVWLSVSGDLRIDAARDLDDLGLEKLPLYPARDAANATLPTGVLDACGIKDGVLFITYSLLISKSAKGSRLDQVVRWLEKDPSGGLILFDECHKAKNLLKAKGSQSTRTAKVVVELQERLPNAKVLYASATGASAPKNLAYMVRLGTFNCGSFQKLLDTLEGGGLGSSELFAMGLKATGTYMCRTLSYTGAEFELASVPLNGALGKMYDRSCEFWMMLNNVLSEVDSGLGLSSKSKSRRFKFAQFWGAHQRFFRQMLLSAKVPALAKAAADAVMNHDMAVVVGLQSTGEANTTAAREEAEEELDDFVSTPQIIITQLIKSQFPIVVSVTAGADFRALYNQVLAICTAWNLAPTVAATLAAAAAGASGAGPSRAVPGESSDDDIIEVGELSFDAAQAEKLERAKRTGMFVDLTTVPSEEELEASRAAAAAAAANLSANASARRAQEAARLQELRNAVIAVAPALLAGAGSGGAASDAVGISSDDDEGRAAPKKRAAPPPKVAAGSVKIGGRALRAGARALRDSASREVSGADDDSDAIGGSDDEDVPIKQRVAAAKPAARKAAGKKKASRAASDSDEDWGSDASSESDESDGGSSDDEDASDGGAPGFPPPKAKVKQEKRNPSVDASEEDDLLEDISPPSKRIKGEAGAHASKPEPNAPDLSDARKAYFGGRYPPRATPARIAAALKSARGGADIESEDEFDLDEDPEDKANLVTDEDDEDAEFLVIDPYLLKTRELMLSVVNALELPANPLDTLIDLLGGVRNVAELTGRKGHMVKDSAGKVRFVKRNEAANVSVKALNLHERDAFMDGKKMVAIISEAASTGISLQADRRAINQRRRLHLTLELPWSADKAIQQFGRSHRSNQLSAPVYRIFVTDVGGERRFAASAAKRLQSLGALLKGDRRALGAGASLKEFDIENRHGSQALQRMYADIQGRDRPLPGVKVPGGDLGAFLGNARSALVAVGLASWSARWPGLAPKDRPIDLKDSEKGNVARFLNRLLGLPLDDQKALFTYFSDTFEAIVAQAKSRGTWDEGLVALKAESIKLVDGFPTRIHTCHISGAETQVVKVELDRGIPFSSALQRLHDFKAECEAAAPGTGRKYTEKNGFWLSSNPARNHPEGKPYIIVATEIWAGTGRRQFRVSKPNIGNIHSHWLDDMEANYRRCSEAEAKVVWDWWFKYAENGCSHGRGCKTRNAGFICTNGMRRSTEALVVGAVLPVWSFVQMVVRKNKKPLRVVRVTTDNDETFVGLHVESEEQLERIIGAVNALDAGAADSDYEMDYEAGAAGGAGFDDDDDEM